MRLFVANFPDEADEETLRGLFAEFGKVVSVKIIKDYETGKRRGFAFVSMPVKYQAERAMKRLDSTDLMGRELAVREARKSVRNRRSGKDRRKRQNPNYKGPERRKNERRGSERRRMRRRD